MRKVILFGLAIAVAWAVIHFGGFRHTPELPYGWFPLVLVVIGLLIVLARPVAIIMLGIWIGALSLLIVLSDIQYRRRQKRSSTSNC